MRHLPAIALASAVLLLLPAPSAAASTSAASTSAASTPGPSITEQAAELLAAQGTRIVEGSFDEALPQIEEARRLFTEAGDLGGQGVSLVLAGMAQHGAGRPAEAREALEGALPLLDEAGDVFVATMARWMLAHGDAGEGRTEAAEARLREALTRLDAVAASRQPVDLRSLALLGPSFGLPAAQLDLPGMGEILRPLLLQFLEVPLRGALAGTLLDAGRLAEAEEELRRAEAGVLAQSFFASSLEQHWGELRRRQWRLDEAREHLQRALAQVGDGPGGLPFADGRFEVAVLRRLAEIESLSGRFEAALQWNDRALVSARGDGDPRAEARLLQDRAELHAHHGDLAEAQRLLDAAWAFATESRDRRLQADVLADRGSYAMRQGTYERSAAALEQALALYEELDEPLLAAPTWVLLAEVYHLLGADGQMEALLARAEDDAERSGFAEAAALARLTATMPAMLAGDRAPFEARLAELRKLPLEVTLAAHLASIQHMVGSLGAASSGEAEQLARGLLHAGGRPGALPGMGHLLLGMHHLEQGEAPEAVREMEQAARLLEGGQQRELSALAWGAVAALRWRSGEGAEARSAAEHSVAGFDEILAHIQVEDLLGSYLGTGRQWIYELLVEMLAEADRPLEAFQQAEKVRARSLLRVLAGSRVQPAGGADTALVGQAEALRASIGEWQRQAAAAPPGEAQRLRQDLEGARRRYQELLVRIKVSSPEYASLVDVGTAPVEQVQAALEPGTSLVSYFVTSFGARAWIVERERFVAVELPADATDLDAVRCLAGRLAGGVPRGTRVLDGCDPTPDLLERLHRQLFAPLEPHLANRRLLVVPHGALHHLPFSALRSPESGRYVVQDYVLTLLPSASVLPFLDAKESPVGGTALVLGEPLGARPALRPLPGARREAEQVAARFVTAPRLGENASETVLREGSAGMDLIHVAAHAAFDSVSPGFSHLVLAPDARHDGRLEVQEIFAGLDLAGVNLVVLSACGTARGINPGGEEIVGLTRALLYAGTPGVVSTLWNIDDGSASELMDHFYHHLLAGRSVAEALRQAQLTLLRSPHHADPVHWAAFTLTGDPQGRWTPALAEQSPEAGAEPGDDL